SIDAVPGGRRRARDRRGRVLRVSGSDRTGGTAAPGARILRRATYRAACAAADGAGHHRSERGPGPQERADRSYESSRPGLEERDEWTGGDDSRRGAGVLRVRDRGTRQGRSEPAGNPTAVGGVQATRRRAETAAPAALRGGAAHPGRLAA